LRTKAKEFILVFSLYACLTNQVTNQPAFDSKAQFHAEVYLNDTQGRGMGMKKVGALMRRRHYAMGGGQGGDYQYAQR
jgi:hypothetical protein